MIARIPYKSLMQHSLRLSQSSVDKTSLRIAACQHTSLFSLAPISSRVALPGRCTNLQHVEEGNEQMKPILVLVSSLDDSLRILLTKQLDASAFQITTVSPGLPLYEFLQCETPEIIVLDHERGRLHSTQMSIAFVKNRNSKSKVIVISGGTADEDAAIIEQGVFYYLNGPPQESLVDVIQAAGKSVLGSADQPWENKINKGR